ncbi:hypothetical protein [Polluticoccus soli]|uniref:hypothetical protein n=1 Tax=Polluticoccus soli TaxID=3034150 RepID=UPI0023E0C62C|nr:hypothetical protein [Flavipsychrobacter sp. JY13-12]
MKKILLALAMIGATVYGASAQKKSAFAKNYRICLIDSKYQVCPKSAKSDLGRTSTIENPEGVLRMMDTSVYLGYSSPFPSFSGMVPSNRRNPRIRVTIDDPQAPYEGKESMINDGVELNKARNINYLDTSVELPANDGGVSDR